MEWTGAKILTDTDGLEILEAELLESGITGFEIEDPRDFEEFLDNTVYYDYIEDDLMSRRTAPVSITAYIPQNAQGSAQLSAIRDLIDRHRGEPGMGSLELVCRSIREEDWAENWKQYFKPINIGKKLVIKPSWEELPDDGGRAVLEIDPSSSFGTGTHATTQLCLETMECIIKPGDEVLDMGCGSGILGIGALLLGAERVTAVDIEENSVKTADENAAKNNIDPARFHTVFGNILSDNALVSGTYDVILANIVADVIIAMSPLFSKFLRESGRVVCSGIISERMGEVIKALLKNGFEITQTMKRDDWVAIAARRH